MPFKVSNLLPPVLFKSLASTASDSRPYFLIIYASLTEEGKSWCGDCRQAQPLVDAIFAGTNPREVKVVYAGQKEEWKDRANVWRHGPFYIEALPTIIKFEGDGKWSKVIEEDVYDEKKLTAFVKTGAKCCD